jgi:hypothetical protein
MNWTKLTKRMLDDVDTTGIELLRVALHRVVVFMK